MGFNYLSKVTFHAFHWSLGSYHRMTQQQITIFLEEMQSNSSDNFIKYDREIKREKKETNVRFERKTTQQESLLESYYKSKYFKRDIKIRFYCQRKS